MHDCNYIQARLLDLLEETTVSGEGRSGARVELAAEIRAHLAACPTCAEEFRQLREAWESLPAAIKAGPPPAVRDRVLAYADQAARRRGRAFTDLWRAVRRVLEPAAAGAAVALAVVAGLHLRGGMAPLGHTALAGLTLSLAVALAAVAGGLWRSAAPRGVRAILVGTLAALAGYFVLTLVSPVPSTVEICRIRLLRDAAMSMGELCLVYLAVAAGYAGLPLAVAANVRPGPTESWLAQALVFSVLALPILVLQAGLREWAITSTAVAGLVLGSLGGAWLGVEARRWRVARAG